MAKRSARLRPSVGEEEGEEDGLRGRGLGECGAYSCLRKVDGEEEEESLRWCFFRFFITCRSILAVPVHKR